MGAYGLQRKPRKSSLTLVKTSLWVCVVFLFLSVLFKVFTFSLLLLWDCTCVTLYLVCSCVFWSLCVKCGWFNFTHLLIFCQSWIVSQKLAVGWEICGVFWEKTVNWEMGFFLMWKKMVERDLLVWMVCFDCFFEGIFVLWTKKILCKMEVEFGHAVACFDCF